MGWRDQGALLSVRVHGESAAIIEVFTAAHGRHAGVVRGGASRRIAPLLQPGAQLDVTWRARLDDHIGAFTVEPVKSRAGVLGDRLALAGLNAVCAMARMALPEREPHPRAFHALVSVIAHLAGGAEDVLADYIRWESLILTELGYGMDLAACAVTGARDGLTHVSPRTGRAVSAGRVG